MAGTDPYLSVVVAARNDDYGGRFLERFGHFLGAMPHFRNRAELVVVEWNPPQDKPALVEALQLPSRCPPIRLIRVPSEVHSALPNADRVPLFDYIAKNVAIRRARGRFVLATNPDVILPPGLLRLLLIGLSRRRFYRVDRYDVDQRIPPHFSPREAVAFCSRNFSRVQTQMGAVDRSQLAKTRMRLLIDRATAYFRPRYRVRKLLRPHAVEPRFANLHLMAPGDFLLMSKDAWFRIRGFPEFPTFAHHDSYACFLAAASGLKEINLTPPFRIYHQEHDRSSQGERPWTDERQLFERGRRMLERGIPDVYNDADWGLAKHVFEERRLV